MAASLRHKGLPLLRLRLQRYNLVAAGIRSFTRRSCCSAAESARHEEEIHSAVPSVRDPPRYHTRDDPDDSKWKCKEEEIFRDIQPTILLVRGILHSNRYMNGERLNVADEEAVVEKLLRYHPHSEEKIGCGLDSIMVDRHPEFRATRCLFVFRTDGGWEDFSYNKCLRAYIRDKYPSHAERFIREHFWHGCLRGKSWPEEVKGEKYISFLKEDKFGRINDLTVCITDQRVPVALTKHNHQTSSSG